MDIIEPEDVKRFRRMMENASHRRILENVKQKMLTVPRVSGSWTIGCQHVKMIHGGGKTRWCADCDFTEEMNSEGEWNEMETRKIDLDN